MSNVNFDALRTVTQTLQSYSEVELDKDAAETTLQVGSQPTNTRYCNQ